MKNNAGHAACPSVLPAAVANEALSAPPEHTGDIQSTHWVRSIEDLYPLTHSPPVSTFFPRTSWLSELTTAWLGWPCSASRPVPPTPLWTSSGGLVHVFCGEEGGLSFICPPPPPPPPCRSFSFFCRRSYVLLVLSSLWANDGRPCWAWESAETGGTKVKHLWVCTSTEGETYWGKAPVMRKNKNLTDLGSGLGLHNLHVQTMRMRTFLLKL